MLNHRHAAEKAGSLQVGKFPPALLREQFKRLPLKNKRVHIGPRVGDDATAIDMGDRFLVCATDPITFTSSAIGRYAVHINANDVAVMGARPLWFWATILLPEGRTDKRTVDEVFSDIGTACDELDVDLCGGHTEITIGLKRPIICGLMAGEASKGRLADKKNISPGDTIILSRGIAIEGTAALAEEKAKQLRSIDQELFKRGRRLLTNPGLSVVREALLAIDSAEIHGMHDPTEGGLFTGLRECAELASVGLEVEEERIIVLPETRTICNALRIDPMGLLASGSLLIFARPESAVRVLAAYRKNGIPADTIGRTMEKDFGIKLKRKGKLVELPAFERDEIARVL
jgi:hydrogenase expression/formation protein HypE